MKVDRNFNKRSAPLIDCGPLIKHGRGDALGICVTLIPSADQVDRVDIGDLRMHMTPADAIQFGLDLIAAGRDRLKAIGKLE
ncbi:hypothetical protein [Bordetella flabilis]|uniref:hypothetical protein n=1 Tax=Bordetella flabilis TaxID=463014 RepID=UPI0012F488C3|nr:hypothetical protein [Bordetella flabilis]